jgi:hypothetical protein
MAFGDLPEGVYQEGGKYWRKVKRLKRTVAGFEYELVPRECSFPLAIDDESVHEAREKAARNGHDFYDPRIVDGQVVGWLSHGRKRSLEWAANLGAGQVQYEREPVPPEENPDAANAPALVTAGRKATNNG